jgi:hypothetical protein
LTSIADELRRAVAARAGGRCEYCHLPQAGQVATFPVDHVEPRTRGGLTVLDNLALSCPHCNAHKWTFTEGTDVDGHAVPIFNPRTDRWAEHFEWSAADPVFLMGKTPTGRATLGRLKMNADMMLITRRLLIELRIPLTPR